MSTHHPLYFLSIVCTALICTGCHSVSGNVIPQGGPSMENIYDGIGVAHPNQHDPINLGWVGEVEKNKTTVHTDHPNMAESDLNAMGQMQTTPMPHNNTSWYDNVKGTGVFRQLPNPALKLYIYPHLVGSDEIPIPGYDTIFNAYDKTHYVLPSDMPHASF